jgi:hypothetical protein
MPSLATAVQVTGIRSVCQRKIRQTKILTMLEIRTIIWETLMALSLGGKTAAIVQGRSGKGLQADMNCCQR